MAGLLSWWNIRSRREQMLLGIMIVLALVCFAWLLVLRPLGDALATAKARHDAAVIALAEARAQAAAIGRIERLRTPRAAVPLQSLIASAAAETGFQLSKLQPDGDDRVTVSIGAAKAQAFFTWLDRLQALGLVVDRLNVTSNGDRTIAVELGLRTRAG